jgi:hypothetical protein
MLGGPFLGRVAAVITHLIATTKNILNRIKSSCYPALLLANCDAPVEHVVFKLVFQYSMCVYTIMWLTDLTFVNQNSDRLFLVGSTWCDLRCSGHGTKGDESQEPKARASEPLTPPTQIHFSSPKSFLRQFLVLSAAQQKKSTQGRDHYYKKNINRDLLKIPLRGGHE